MCGISGITTSKHRKVDLDKIILKNLSLQDHRGPDEKNYLKINENLVFGHNRLSIQDLSKNGSQPMYSKTKNLLITFNGEIYNHLELRNKFKNELNHNWKSTCDTETLINLIESIGLKNTLENIDGMFAFAYFDYKNNKIFLVRDIFGEKPLYFYRSDDLFAFASDIKFLSKIDNIDKNLNHNAIFNYLKYSYISSPNSIYKKIFKLEPGTILEIDFKKFDQKLDYTKKYQWYNLHDKIKNSKKNLINNFNEAKITLEDKISKSVSKQMISDVPIGSFLSGGIDSSLITALMQKNSNKKIDTFSIKFQNKEFDESDYARKVADKLGTNHNELFVSEKDILNTIDNIDQTFGEPFGDSSQIPMYLLSHFTKKKVTVSLSGDGADELFCGYNRYKYINTVWRIYKIFKMNKKIFYKIFNGIPNRVLVKLINFFKLKSIAQLDDKISKFKSITKNIENQEDLFFRLISNFDYTPPEIEETLGDFDYEFREKMMIFDTISYLSDDILCKVDRTAMSSSLETRIPFLDKEVFEYAWQIPIKYKINSKEQKYILKKILENYLPNELIYRPKMGFSIDMNNILKGELKEIYFDSLNLVKKQNFNFFENINLNFSDIPGANDARGNNFSWNIIILAKWLRNNKYN